VQLEIIGMKEEKSFTK